MELPKSVWLALNTLSTNWLAHRGKVINYAREREGKNFMGEREREKEREKEGEKEKQKGRERERERKRERERERERAQKKGSNLSIFKKRHKYIFLVSSQHDSTHSHGWYTKTLQMTEVHVVHNTSPTAKLTIVFLHNNH